MEERDVNQSTVRLIETVAQHGYMQIAALIDGNHIDEARQIAELLKVVGIV